MARRSIRDGKCHHQAERLFGCASTHGLPQNRTGCRTLLRVPFFIPTAQAIFLLFPGVLYSGPITNEICICNRQSSPLLRGTVHVTSRPSRSVLFPYIPPRGAPAPRPGIRHSLKRECNQAIKERHKQGPRVRSTHDPCRWAGNRTIGGSWVVGRGGVCWCLV